MVAFTFVLGGHAPLWCRNEGHLKRIFHALESIALDTGRGMVAEEERLKILLLSRYSLLGASSRVRFYQYLSYLNAHSFRITVSPLLDDTYLKTLYAHGRVDWELVFGSYYKRLRQLLTSRSYDLIWIEK